MEKKEENHFPTRQKNLVLPSSRWVVMKNNSKNGNRKKQQDLFYNKIRSLPKLWIYTPTFLSILPAASENIAPNICPFIAWDIFHSYN